MLIFKGKKGNKILASLLGFLLFPCVFTSAHNIENEKVKGNSESFFLAKEKIQTQIAQCSEKINSFAKDSKNLFDCLEKIYKNNGFETTRLKMDKLKETDIDSIAEQIYDEDITKYYFEENDSILENFKYCNLNIAKAHIKYRQKYYNTDYDNIIGNKDFAIRLKETGEPIGILGYDIEQKDLNLTLEINYFLGKSYQNKGYAKEAAINLTKHIFDRLSRGTIIINFHIKNEKSKKLADAILDNFFKNDSDGNYKKNVFAINNMLEYTLEKID